MYETAVIHKNQTFNKFQNEGDPAGQMNEIKRKQIVAKNLTIICQEHYNQQDNAKLKN